MANKQTQKTPKSEKFIKFAQPVCAVILALSALLAGGWYFYQWFSQREIKRQETYRNLLNEFDSDDPLIRKSAAKILIKRYPEDASKKFTKKLKAEEDQVLVNELMDYIRQIGKDAIIPLRDELKQLQKELDLLQIKLLLGSDEDRILFKTIMFLRPKACKYFSEEVMEEASGRYEALVSRLSVNGHTALNLDIFATPTTLEAIKIKLKWEDPQQPKIEEMGGEIKLFFNKLENIWSSNSKLISTHKNFITLLPELLSRHHVKNLPLSSIDFSSIKNLSKIDFSGADLENAILTNVRMEDVNLSGADLTKAKLYDAWLAGVDLTGANLTNADLSDATFTSAPLGERWVKLKSLPGEVKFPGYLQDKIMYWPMEKYLIFYGPMTKTDMTVLLPLSQDRNWRKAVEQLFKLCHERKMKGFREIKDFTKTNLKGVKGLSEEELEYAESKGAIIGK